MDIKRKALTGSVVNFVRSVGETIIGLLAFVVFARLLSPEAFGLFAIATGIVMSLQPVTNLGFVHAVVQKETVTDTIRDTAFWSVFTVSLATMILVWLLASPLAQFFDQPRLDALLKVLSVSFLLNGYSDISRSLLVRNLDYPLLALCSLLATGFGGVAGVLVAFVYDGGVWGLVTYKLGITLAGSVGYFLSAGWFPGFRFSFDKFKTLFVFGGNVIGNKVVKRVGNKLDDLIIGFFLGSTSLGYFVIAYRVYSLVEQFLIGAFVDVALPLYSRFQTETERLRRTFRTSIRLNALIAFPLIALVILLAPMLVPLVFGDQWVRAVPVLQILMLAGFGEMLLRYIGSMLLALGRPSADFMVNVIRSLMIVGFFLLVVHRGLVAVSIAFVLTVYLSIFVALRLLLQELEVRVGSLGRQFLVPAGASVFGAGAVVLISVVSSPDTGSSYGKIILRSFVMIGSYVGIIWLFVPRQLTEMIRMCRDLIEGTPEEVLADDQLEESES